MLPRNYTRAKHFSLCWYCCVHPFLHGLLQKDFMGSGWAIHFVGQKRNLPEQRCSWKGATSVCHAALPVPLHGSSIRSPQTLPALMLRLSISHRTQQHNTEKLQKWPFEDLCFSSVICKGKVLIRIQFT